MTKFCFVDCETTGLHEDRRAWEIALITVDTVTGAEGHRLLHVRDVDLTTADLHALRLGGFYQRHCHYGITGLTDPDARPVEENVAAATIEKATRDAVLVGVGTYFDAETLASMLRRNRLTPAWHYSLVDVKAMAVGWLAARQHFGDGMDAGEFMPPASSDALSRLCGVEPPGEDDRHTAMGDALWARRWFEKLVDA